MIPRKKRIELLQIFSNAARLGDVETMTQAEINRLSPKLRKIFQQQYDIFHDHFPDEEPEEVSSKKGGGSSLLSQLATITVASLALNKAFSHTEKEFKEVLTESTERIANKAAEKLEKQIEPVVKAITEKEPSWPEPVTPKTDAELGYEWKYSNPDIHEKLEARAAQMVKDIDETTRQDIHDIIVKGHEENKSYSEIAKNIREQYEEFSTPKPQGHIRDRAELIAVTEIGHAAQETSYEESIALADEGWEVEKFWNNTGDEKVSDGCLENTDAGWIPIDEPFPSGDQFAPRFPGCRCSVSYRLLGRKK